MTLDTGSMTGTWFQLLVVAFVVKFF